MLLGWLLRGGLHVIEEDLGHHPRVPGCSDLVFTHVPTYAGSYAGARVPRYVDANVLHAWI